jgi:23S rRNA-/tRNA-specific pseudouridylate synthase
MSTAHLLSQGLRTIYEDDDLAVVFKPAGVHTKRNTVAKYGAFEDALPAVLTPPPRTAEGGVDSTAALPLPLAVHRLDVRVCGLIIVAKSRLAARELAMQFQASLAPHLPHLTRPISPIDH